MQSILPMFYVLEHIRAHWFVNSVLYKCYIYIYRNKNNLLWTRLRIGYKYPNINGNNGQNDTEQCNGGKLADELHPQKHPHEHDQE